MEVFVARQPILDRHMEIFGYELLFRSAAVDAYDGLDPDQASSSIIMNGTLLLDFQELTQGRAAFVNVTRQALVERIVEVLPTDTTIVEILETVEPDDEVYRACVELKEKGFRIALDDFVYSPEWDGILALTDIVKVDFLTTTREQRRELATHIPDGVTLLAEKLETPDLFDEALEDGYTLFQGYFFQKPLLLRKRSIPENQAFYAELLQELQSRELDITRLVGVIKRDPSLTYKFLRFINRPTFGWRRQIEDLEQAIFLVGEAEIRKWMTLLVMASLAPGKPLALLQNASIRARMCELLAPLAGLKQRSMAAFLVGMFSQIDAFTDQPMGEALDLLPLDESVRTALLGEENDLRRLLDVVRAYERGAWQEMQAAAEAIGVGVGEIPPQYVLAVRWATRGNASDLV